MKMLEKLNEINKEISEKLNRREFKIENPHITKSEKITSLRCDIVIDDTKFNVYTDDSGDYVSACCANINWPSLKEEDKKGLIKYIWMESSSIISAQLKDEQDTLNRVIEKIA